MISGAECVKISKRMEDQKTEKLKQEMESSFLQNVRAKKGL